MAVTYRTETVGRQVIDSIDCDRCGLSTHGDGDAVLDAQEFMHWRHTCGYNSIFGDGNKLSVDLCQSCAKEVLGEYICVADGQW